MPKNLSEKEKLVKEQGTELHVTNEKLPTERKQAEEQLQAASLYTRGLLEVSLNPIMIINPDGTITDVNSATELIIGFSREHLIGSDFSTYFTEPGKAKVMYQQALLQGTIRDDLLTIRHTSGQLTDVLCNATVYKDEAGEVQRVFVSAHDITKRKRMEEELRQTNLQLQEASQHKSDFLANMSHELRTPLNAIIGFTAMTIDALRDTIPPEHLQNLLKAEQAARILMQLISDILDFSKIETEQMDTYIEEFPLEDLIEEILVTTKGLLVDKMIELNSEIDPDIPFVESDYIKMKQILNKLVSNAVKFTTEGGVTIRAKTISRPEPDGGVRVEVEDTGCGIPEDKLATIFTSFKQVDGSIKKRFGGTGLGLAITKKLCDSLGIEIGLRSEKGKGTTCWLNIPVKYHLSGSRAEQTINAQYPAPGIQKSGKEMEEEFFPELSSNAVVACFSTQETCEMIKQYFGGLPLELRRVSTVAECIELGNSRLVWMILAEPDGEGFEALTQLKREPALSHIPIIFCSLEAKEKGFYQLGPVEHLTKPVDRKQLLEVLLRIAKQQGDILVVDDDPNIRALYGQILSRAGYIPHVVENGLEALDFLRNHPLPQAMILDLLMPEMDGFQVLDCIQASETWRRIPIVVVTGKTSSPEERKRIDKGAQLLLHKDTFPIEELPKQIESVVHTVTLAGRQSILVVDDNQMNLDLIAGVFRTAGYTVYTANSGQEGVDTAKAVMPDVIVMDLAMPEMDGFEATQQIKQHPPTADIAVIACSAFATIDYQKRAFQAGCEGYITKPIEPEHLIEQITKLILTSKIRRRIRKYGKDISDR